MRVRTATALTASMIVQIAGQLRPLPKSEEPFSFDRASFILSLIVELKTNWICQFIIRRNIGFILKGYKKYCFIINS